ncbi:hypothetical protein TSOC_007637 [Tetrabaena socialis]|uniref:Sucrose phosphatase-like domain-containing protein n=1 Tax=Tetrabaena socialis TaxID=47790 RepID=A0A2J8A0I5_9CHLO|nr:hypothetical protein TSOC_007637 [Tetrabaena socialis]|eukprot:PNH06029.1 hypothetical protein TSOC_007637 [Tetrabaena socialis]
MEPKLASSAGACALPRLLRPLLLISDLDDTLVGGEGEGDDASQCDAHSRELAAALARWRNSAAASRAEGASSGAPDCRLAINTGRTLPLFLRAVAERGAEVIPEADVLVAGVGTRIYVRRQEAGPMGSASGWEEHLEWSAAMSRDWDIEAVRSAVEDAMQHLGPDSMAWRNQEENDGLKLTVVAAVQALPDLVGFLDARLRAAEVRYRIVVGPTLGWAYLDFLPGCAGKNAAAHYVRRLLGSDAAAVVVSGDAPNDLDMLAGASQAIVVANCHESVRHFAVMAVQWQDEQQPRTPPAGAPLSCEGAACCGAAVAVELGPAAEQVVAVLTAAAIEACDGDSCGAGASVFRGVYRWGVGVDIGGLAGTTGVPSGEGRVDSGGGAEPPTPLRRVHLASRPSAAGVLEGLSAFGFVQRH